MLAPSFLRNMSACLLTLAVIAVELPAQSPRGRATSPVSSRRVATRGFVPGHERRSATSAVGRSVLSENHAARAVGSSEAASSLRYETALTDVVSEVEVGEPVSPIEEVIPEGSWEFEPEHVVGEPEACGCPSCASEPGWGSQVVPGFWVDHLSLLAGVHGFKNESNRGEDASFGFHTGFNYGTPARNILLPPSMGLQIGFRANFSNFEGSSFTPTDREQFFLTTGVFRRGDCGLQGGLVFDYLWDKWYYDLAVGQLRGELSLAMSEWNTWGFWFASAVSSDRTTSRIEDSLVGESWETADIYAIFYRSRLLAANTGEGRLYGGFTGEGDGLIGAETKLPLHNGWALETDFAYLIPKKDFDRFEREAWNVAVNLVWYPGSLACGSCFRYHRPLFDVANNGSMILQRQQ